MFLTIFITISLLIQIESSRILAVFPTPLISHQSAHRSIIHELLQRGHDIVLITPLPEYPKGDSPENLTEIDVSNVTNEVWDKRYDRNISTKDSYINEDFKNILRIATKVVEKQFESEEIKSFIHNNETFDLLLLETWIRPTLFWTYVYDVPVISVSSLGSLFNEYQNIGGPMHPLLYPTSLQRDVWNENFWQKILAVNEYWKLDSMLKELEIEEDALAKKLFGDVPPLREQMKKIELLVLNIHPAWQGARPVPKNVVHLGATHLQDRNKSMHLSPQMEEILDLSTAGVVYVSQGTNVRPSMVPEHLKHKLIRAFSKLPCSVLWKWDEVLKDLPYNVRLGKWFPQAALLNHPNVKLFLSQCGQQSIDEAIAAAVPVLGLPLTGDQWRNAELLAHHKVGATVDLETIGDEELRNIIELSMKNESYRTNMHRLRTAIFDAPAPAPARAADAIEYVLRHSSVMLESPSRLVSWYQYLEIELLLIVSTIFCVKVFLLYKLLSYLLKEMFKKMQ
ncbi:UDP-glucosyltransferase 2 [Spodoptera frugiperda]|uniref:UDP-glucuronosyltransferase n=1 Tax=Spodoptera frugiperda TaxID=7108 RepID=A0A9R0EQV9_SPOFR|nr:UDP-glucosyltransferase 2 [Spodoptera frugiperda]